MAVSSVNPFQLGNIGRAYGASTYQPVKNVEFTSPSTAQKINGQQAQKGFFPSTEEMELASQIADGDLSSALKVQRTQAVNPFDARGAAWEGFSVPNNNGTGELIPQLRERKYYDYKSL